MAGDGGGDALARELAVAGPDDPDDAESGKAAEDVGAGRARGVEEAGAQAEVFAQAAEPARSPDPVSEEGEDQRGKDRGDGQSSGHAQAIGTGAPGNERGHGDGEKFKKDAELGAR